MDRTTLFVDVILPLPIPGLYTYRVPYEMNGLVETGRRVVVQFGKKKIYTALIAKIHENIPLNYTPKYLLTVLDNKPIVNTLQFKFWEWIGKYYMCRPGDVMNTAIPSVFKLASESVLVIHPEFDRNFSALSDKEFLIAEALDINQKLTLTEISNIVEQQKIISLIQTLIEKKVVLTEEQLHEKYKPKSILCVRLAAEYQAENGIERAEKIIGKKAHKQSELFLAYLQLTHFALTPSEHISRKELLQTADANASQLQSLIKKGVFQTYEFSVTRLKETEATDSANSIQLSNEQQTCYNTIKTGFESKDVVLLHGVTSSGKTEIYIKLIEETLQKNQQVLFLLPEIALTAQIINRLRKYFGRKVGVYHSKYNKDEKAEIWHRLIDSDYIEKDSGYQIILGARSSVFLPFSNLGLVIVDEEHDTSYKQNDPAPRYNGRDAAIFLASLHEAKTLLGSATPAIESYYNVLQAKYGLAELKVRYGSIDFPEIEIVNLKDQVKQKKMKSFFSEVLWQQMHDVLKNQEQVILFQNRRGFSTRVECDHCHWIPQCKYCDVSLVYHKQINLLKCHYCGYSTTIPEQCPACTGTHLLTKGLGTERVEEETAALFTDYSSARLDLDSTRSKHAYFEIINDFEERKTQILIGTQMVTKGLDFENVGLVSVLNADNMLNYPDFRSHERCFQLMTQVSGRAGRRDKRGKVIIQTYNPQHPIIQQVLHNEYEKMCMQQLHQRKQFLYPPYSKLIQITLKHKNKDILNEAAKDLAQKIRELFAKQVFGPEYPVVSRIKNLFLKNILLKLHRNKDLSVNKNKVLEIITLFQKSHSSLSIVIDVDP